MNTVSSDVFSALHSVARGLRRKEGSFFQVYPALALRLAGLASATVPGYYQPSLRDWGVSDLCRPAGVRSVFRFTPGVACQRDCPGQPIKR
jgi:hypothetical protein